jgi:hypothetical protein
MIAMVKYSRRHNQSSLHTSSTILSLKLCDELDVSPSDSKDLHKALGKVYPFFNPEFLDTDKGEEFKDSMLFKQEERARAFPDIRTHISTKHRPEEFYAELDKKLKETKHDDDLDALPFEWDMNIRPILAHRKSLTLYRLLRNFPDRPSSLQIWCDPQSCIHSF